MVEHDEILEKNLNKLNFEYRRISRRLNEIAFKILDMGGTLPSEVECEAAVRDAERISPTQKGQVYLLEVDWRGLIMEAMKQIPNPCALKSITEEIVSNHKTLAMSTTHNHVRIFMNFLVETKEVRELPRGEKKYFLVE